MGAQPRCPQWLGAACESPSGRPEGVEGGMGGPGVAGRSRQAARHGAPGRRHRPARVLAAAGPGRPGTGCRGGAPGGHGRRRGVRARGPALERRPDCVPALRPRRRGRRAPILAVPPLGRGAQGHGAWGARRGAAPAPA
eukprot:8053118-Lingulodinium_polyedra.AAC.1